MAVEGNKGGEAGSDARRDVGEARRDGGEVRREEGNSYCITLAVQLITSAAISEEQKLELIQLVACESNLAKTLCATPPSVLLQQCLRLLRQSGKSGILAVHLSLRPSAALSENAESTNA